MGQQIAEAVELQQLAAGNVYSVLYLGTETAWIKEETKDLALRGIGPQQAVHEDLPRFHAADGDYLEFVGVRGDFPACFELVNLFDSTLGESCVV